MIRFIMSATKPSHDGTYVAFDQQLSSELNHLFPVSPLHPVTFPSLRGVRIIRKQNMCSHMYVLSVLHPVLEVIM